MKEKKVFNIAVIAGEGEFPLILIRSLLNQGFNPFVITFSRGQHKKIKSLVEDVEKLKIGQLQKIFDLLKDREIKDVVFLGKIDKSYAFKVGIPDKRAFSLWKRLKKREDDSILRAVIKEFEKEGFKVRGASEFLKEYLTQKKVYTRRTPTQEEWEDIEYGLGVALKIGELDIGQCVVVKDKMTVAVEAMEGTDKTILRAGKLRKNGIVVKISKPIQDLRMDLPVVGLETIKTMIKAKAKVLAIQAEKTFFLQQEEAIKKADKFGISIVGV